MVIFLGFEKCSYMQFLILVEYNKKGFNYVKLTHEVYNHRKKHIKIINAQWTLQSWRSRVSRTIKSWIWIFISQCVYAMYVRLWDIKYLKFRTFKVHLVNEKLT